MGDANSSQRINAVSDRRFLKRSEVGRRAEDLDRAYLLAGNDVEEEGPRATPATYLFVFFAILMIGVVSVRSMNAHLAPLLYSDSHVSDVAEALSTGGTYLTYDLNIETRGLRRDSIRHLKKGPDLAVMGASHWQEAHSALMPDVDFYNAHVHRDYYEDLVAVAGWFFRFDRMPKTLIISIRDNQFTPVEERTDFLWVPVLPEYRAAAPIFGLEAHTAYANGLTPRLRHALSLPVLMANFQRHFEAPVLPGPSRDVTHETLDVLLPDGGIYWSETHRRSFTPERARAEALALAEQKIEKPPVMDPAGLEVFDRVLEFMVSHGVKVYVTHPPFNPIFWDAVQGTRYLPALAKVEETVRAIAEKHGAEVIGGFDPKPLGCTPEMYIDGEHSNPMCLGEILLLTAQDVPRLAHAQKEPLQ